MHLSRIEVINIGLFVSNLTTRSSPYGFIPEGHERVENRGIMQVNNRQRRW
jgi:hypothetical protein